MFKNVCFNLVIIQVYIVREELFGEALWEEYKRTLFCGKKI